MRAASHQVEWARLGITYWSHHQVAILHSEEAKSLVIGLVSVIELQCEIFIGNTEIKNIL